ncbi:anti-sigma factor family protein [Mesorhizobium marinum]|uniref:Anti-sigma factor n=1 Tax=Mesorhizobium marinum TaxID=3228790 RepID=A0ABV3R0X4_9HYPH
MTRRDFTERDIHMALDGEMPQDERDDFAAWLDANPEMKSRSSRFEADRERLRASLSDVLAEPVPERLTALVAGETPKATARAPRWRMAAAAALLLALGAGGGYFAGAARLGMGSETAEDLSEAAIAAHAVYAAEQRHAVEVGAGDRDHLLGWLSSRLGLTLVAPDLSSDGFELVGGRLLPAGHRSAAMLLYEDAKGSRLSIYVTPEGAAKSWGTYDEEQGDLRAIYWLDKGWGCAVVGTLAPEKLLELGRKAYRQMLAGAGMA